MKQINVASKIKQVRRGGKKRQTVTSRKTQKVYNKIKLTKAHGSEHLKNQNNVKNGRLLSSTFHPNPQAPTSISPLPGMGLVSSQVEGKGEILDKQLVDTQLFLKGAPFAF